MTDTAGLILSPVPAPLFTPTRKAAKRVLEFFTAQINNDRTRKAYLNSRRPFVEWAAWRRPFFSGLRQ